VFIKSHRRQPGERYIVSLCSFDSSISSLNSVSFSINVASYLGVHVFEIIISVH